MSTHIQLPKLNSLPRYLQVANTLLSLFESGFYKPGDRVPPEDELAGQLGVSRLTLREAMSFLEKEGWVTRRQGVGTFVTIPAGALLPYGLERLVPLRSLANAANLDLKIAEQEASTITGDEERADYLGLEPGSDLVRIQAVISIGEQRMAYFDSFASPKRIDIEVLINENLTFLEYLVSHGEPVPSYTRSVLHARRASPEVAARLQLEVGDPLLEIFEIYYSREDRPVAVSRDFLITEVLEYHIVRRVVA